MKEEIDHMLDPVIPIGVVADRVGLSVSAIRKYEAEGLLIAHRTSTGRRMYSIEDIERIRTIQHMIQDLGLNMEGIRRLLAMLPCWRLSSLRPRERNACPAFNDTTKPCWMSDSPQCAPEKDKCRICPVYRYGTQHTEHIKRLVFSQTDDEAVKAIHTLLEQTDKPKAPR